MKHIVTPIAAVVLAAVMAHCNDGCASAQLSPTDAYGAELSACAANRNADIIGCARSSWTKQEADECRARVQATYEVCRDAVDRKYGL